VPPSFPSFIYLLATKFHPPLFMRRTGMAVLFSFSHLFSFHRSLNLEWILFVVSLSPSLSVFRTPHRTASAPPVAHNPAPCVFSFPGRFTIQTFQ